MASDRRSQGNMSLARRRACSPCVASKTRCDQKRGGCSRCRKKSIVDQCIYSTIASYEAEDEIADHQSSSVSNTPKGQYYETTSPSVPASLQSTRRDVEFPRYGPGMQSADSRAVNGSLSDSNAVEMSVQATDISSSSNIRVPRTASSRSQPSDRVDDRSINFKDLDLVCTINAEAIRDRWQNQYLPLPGQALKTYPSAIIALISRMLKAYSSMAVHYSSSVVVHDGTKDVTQNNTLPPFVHWMQRDKHVSASHLSTCFSLASLCNKPLPSTAVKTMLQDEMIRIRSDYLQYGDVELLEAFQAYLINAMLIYFNFDENRDSGLQETMIYMKEIAYQTSRQGLMCGAEQDRARPTWEAWIIAEAKRRTLYTMYLFDNLLCTRDGLPTYLGTELQTIPAPAARSLWYATNRESWILSYNAFIHQWGAHGPLRIDELWATPPTMRTDEVMARCNRVDHWLMSLDEFGTMLFAVTSCTHGE